MNIFTTCKLALRALWRNKVRTLLTMLGIVFGIGAVIAMVASGQGAQAAVKDVFQFASSDATCVLVVIVGTTYLIVGISPDCSAATSSQVRLWREPAPPDAPNERCAPPESTSTLVPSASNTSLTCACAP